MKPTEFQIKYSQRIARLLFGGSGFDFGLILIKTSAKLWCVVTPGLWGVLGVTWAYFVGSVRAKTLPHVQSVLGSGRARLVVGPRAQRWRFAIDHRRDQRISRLSNLHFRRGRLLDVSKRPLRVSVQMYKKELSRGCIYHEKLRLRQRDYIIASIKS